MTTEEKPKVFIVDLGFNESTGKKDFMVIFTEDAEKADFMWRKIRTDHPNPKFRDCPYTIFGTTDSQRDKLLDKMLSPQNIAYTKLAHLEGDKVHIRNLSDITNSNTAELMDTLNKLNEGNEKKLQESGRGEMVGILKELSDNIYEMMKPFALSLDEAYHRTKMKFGEEEASDAILRILSPTLISVLLTMFDGNIDLTMSFVKKLNERMQKHLQRLDKTCNTQE